MPRGPNLGAKLLAAGVVLGIGALIQVAQDEPMAPLLVPAVVLAGIGIKVLWRQDADRSSAACLDLASTASGGGSKTPGD